MNVNMQTTDNQLEKLSQRFKFFRNTLNKGQKDFANEAGITQSQVSEIEGGKRNITAAIYIALEDAFNLNRKWLETGDGEMFLNNNNNIIIERETEPANDDDVIPLYSDVHSIGGTSVKANNAVSRTTEYVRSGDWFPGATAAIRHYGDSMIEFPSGCILVLQEKKDLTNSYVWGRKYVVEYGEDHDRITKRLQRGNDEKSIIAYSTNENVYKDGTLIHQPIDIPKSAIHRLYLILGFIVKDGHGNIVEKS